LGFRLFLPQFVHSVENNGPPTGYVKEQP